MAKNRLIAKIGLDLLSTFVHSKGGLILEGILTLVPLPTKSAKSLSCAENLNFPPLTVDSLDKFSAQESDLAIVGNGTKVKIPSEIKPPIRV